MPTAPSAAWPRRGVVSTPSSQPVASSNLCRLGHPLSITSTTRRCSATKLVIVRLTAASCVLAYGVDGALAAPRARRAPARVRPATRAPVRPRHLVDRALRCAAASGLANQGRGDNCDQRCATRQRRTPWRGANQVRGRAGVLGHGKDGAAVPIVFYRALCRPATPRPSGRSTRSPARLGAARRCSFEPRELEAEACRRLMRATRRRETSRNRLTVGRFGGGQGRSSGAVPTAR